MNKYKKILAEDGAKKDLVLSILKLLNGESYDDCKQILDIAAAVIKETAFLDIETAENIIAGDD